MEQKSLLAIRVKRIFDLDLEPTKFKLVHDGWTIPRADTAEGAYKQFLILALKNPEQPLVPAGDIDDFWHAHVLDTAKYAADCEAALGRFLHHFPYSGLLGEEDAAQQRANYAKTCELHLLEFGEPYAPGQAAAGCEDCCPDYDCDSPGKLPPLERPRPRLNRQPVVT